MPTFLVGVVGDLVLLLHEELVVVLDAGGEEVELGPGGGQPGVGLGLAAVLLVLVLDQAHDVVLGAALDPARELPHLVVLQHATCHVSRVTCPLHAPHLGLVAAVPSGPGALAGDDRGGGVEGGEERQCGQGAVSRHPGGCSTQRALTAD